MVKAWDPPAENNNIDEVYFILKSKAIALEYGSSYESFIRVATDKNGAFEIADKCHDLETLIEGMAWAEQTGHVELKQHYSFSKPQLFPDRSIQENGILVTYSSLTPAEQEQFDTTYVARLEQVRAEARENRQLRRGGMHIQE